jgi:hypothetical protein
VCTLGSPEVYPFTGRTVFKKRGIWEGPGQLNLAQTRQSPFKRTVVAQYPKVFGAVSRPKEND